MASSGAKQMLFANVSDLSWPLPLSVHVNLSPQRVIKMKQTKWSLNRLSLVVVVVVVLLVVNWDCLPSLNGLPGCLCGPQAGRRGANLATFRSPLEAPNENLKKLQLLEKRRSLFGQRARRVNGPQTHTLAASRHRHLFWSLGWPCWSSVVGELLSVAAVVVVAAAGRLWLSAAASKTSQLNDVDSLPSVFVLVAVVVVVGRLKRRRQRRQRRRSFASSLVGAAPN